MAIYERDNYADGLRNALDAAFNRRQASRDREAERLNRMVNTGADIFKIIGREQDAGAIPDKYKNDPAYRASRLDYILSGDRSGLDAFSRADLQAAENERQRIYQAGERAAQRDFQEEQNAFNRALQMSEGDKNRAVQREMHGLNKVTEKAKLVKEMRDATAIRRDTFENPSSYKPLDIAKTKNNEEMQYSLLVKSGLFTPEELNNFKPLTDAEYKKGLAPAPAPTPTPTPAGGNVPEDALQAWQLASPELMRRAKEAKDLAEIEAIGKELEGYNKDFGNAKEYEDIIKELNASKTKIENRIAAEKKKKAENDFIMGSLNDTSFISPLQVNNLLLKSKDGEIDVHVPYNNVTETIKLKVTNLGNRKADISRDGVSLGVIEY